MADNLDHVILCLQNIQWLYYEIPACIFFACVSKLHSPRDQYVVFSLVKNVKMLKKKNGAFVREYQLWI